MQNSIADRGKTNRGEEPVRIESFSRPGFFHHVDLERSFCSCEAKSFGTVETCRHLRIAAIRAAKAEPEYLIERKHNSRISDFEYLIIRKINGREEVLGFRPTRAMAELDITDIVSGLEVA